LYYGEPHVPSGSDMESHAKDSDRRPRSKRG
jgi:hypothetical protein